MRGTATIDSLATPEDGPVGPALVLRWTVWFGLVGGGLELLAFLAKCHWLDPRNYFVGRHFVWMHPLAGLAVAAVPGVVLALASGRRGRGRLPAGVVAGSLAFGPVLGLAFRAPMSTVACLSLSAGLAVQIGRWLSTTARVERFDRVVRRSLPVLIALVAATAAVSFGRGLVRAHHLGGVWSRPTPPAGARNVLLVVLDTVRADRLGLYGHHRDTSPNLARLAARGVRFERAMSTAPWTAPSHASLFTGRRAGELSIGWAGPLDRSAPTLAEHLAARGYDTAGFVANTTYCSYETGLDRGFARYDDYDLSPRAVLHCSAVVQRTLDFVRRHPALARWLGQTEGSAFRKDARRINADLLDWLSKRGDRPFFAFLNYYDAHHPYLLPGPWPEGPAWGRPATADDRRFLKEWWGLDKRRLSPERAALASDAYDLCIAYLDAQLGRLLDTLERRGLLRETLVIVTADHGEHLGERHLYGHGVSLYQPELHVPLIVVDEGRVPAGRVARAPVSLRDVAATVVDQLGPAPGAPALPGRSLAWTWTGPDDGPRPPGEPVRSEVASAPEDDPNHGSSPARGGPMTSLVDGPLHYIRNGDGREELYDLAADPLERSDLATSSDQAAALDSFRAWLRR